MKEYISDEWFEAAFGKKGYYIGNHDQVWISLDEYRHGRNTPKSDEVWSVFFFKVGAIMLQKMFPSYDERYLDQEGMLTQLYMLMRAYYLNIDEMEDRIFKHFPIGADLILKPGRKNIKEQQERKRFLNHFLWKAKHELTRLVSDAKAQARSEIDYDDWAELASDSLVAQMDSLGDYYELRKNKEGELEERKVSRDKLIHPDRIKSKGGVPTSPQEAAVIYEESVYDFIKRTSRRKLEGQKLSDRIDTALGNSDWRDKPLVGDYPWSTIREFYMSDPEEFLMCTFFDVGKGFVPEYTIKLLEESDSMTQAPVMMWLTRLKRS